MLLHFLCRGCEYKESKMEESAYCGLGAKIPGAGAVLEKNRSGAPGILYGFAFASSNGVISLPAGFCFASRGGFHVVRGTGRPAGSCYLRFGGVLPEVVTSVWGASRRKSLPPFGGVPPEVVTSVWGRPAGSRYLRLGGVPPGVVTSAWGASRRKGFLCSARALPDRVISSSARCP